MLHSLPRQALSAMSGRSCRMTSRKAFHFELCELLAPSATPNMMIQQERLSHTHARTPEKTPIAPSKFLPSKSQHTTKAQSCSQGDLRILFSSLSLSLSLLFVFSLSLSLSLSLSAFLRRIHTFTDVSICIYTDLFLSCFRTCAMADHAHCEE